MPSLLSLGATALNAANVGLRTTGHNIANVNTPGYSRQTTIQSAPNPQFTGIGYFGRGVQIDTIRRVYSEFLTSQAHLSTAQAGEAAERTQQLELVNSTLGSTDGGVAQSLTAFYAALDSATNHPSDLSARQAALSSAQSLATQFNNAAMRLSDQRRSVESQMRATVADVNTTLADFATVNAQISALLGNGQPANDLLDRRDTLQRTLSEKLGVTSVVQDGDLVSLFVGNGQPLVIGGNASTLELQPNPYDPEHPVIGVRRGSTFSALDPQSLSGGSLTGLVKFADADLSQVQDDVGRLALAVATAYNARHRLGVDAEGLAGQDLFKLGPTTAIAAGTNTGTGAISATIADATALSASGYRIDYDGTQYSILRLSDRQKTTYATLPQTVDGLTFAMTGTPAAGDGFMVNVVRSAAETMGAAINRPASLALALPVGATLGASNIGSVRVSSLAVPGPTAGANLTQPVTIRFTSATTFDVTGTGTGNPTSVAYTPGQAITYNGWTLKLEGVPNVGDTVALGASTSWTGDNRNGLALGGVNNALLVDGLNLSDAMSGLFGKVGSVVSSARAISDVQSAVRDESIASEQSVGGVNLDEEAARLLQYQQAYQAAAKVIATAQSVFDTLVGLIR